MEMFGNVWKSLISPPCIGLCNYSVKETQKKNV